MKVILFGTGDYYNKYKNWFEKEDIVGILDNDQQKQGTVIDGIQVYAPEDGVRIHYNKICVMSVYYEDIKDQLVALGVSEESIINCVELYKYPELTKTDQNSFFYNKEGQQIGYIISEPTDILLMSRDLDFNGATLALYYVACTLVKNGYQVWFASWTDGMLRHLLSSQGIGVIVDPNLQIKTARNVSWMKEFRYVICNTLLYSTLLLERADDTKFVWWLHEPELFYLSIDKELAKRIDGRNLKAYAVGPVAMKAFRNSFSHINVKELLYGIPDVSKEYVRNKDNAKIEFITIGNVQEYKGQDVLVDAIRILPDKYKKKIHICIIGGKDSLFYTKVKQSADKFFGLIDFMPPLERNEVYEIYSNADAFICPSREDCMPVVVAESMMFSLPCIVSDSTGIAPYAERSGGGLVFQCGDSLELSNRICWCVDHKDDLKEMGKLSRKEYEKSFSMRILEENIMNIVRGFFGCSGKSERHTHEE